MSIRRTKEHLIQALNQADNHVIALSGKWGTGKTHLWNEIRKESADEKVKGALYVSLFGLSSTDQVKRKLIEAAIPGAESNVGIIEIVKQFFKSGMKAAADHYKAMAVLNDLNFLLMAPLLFRNKLIVIDDIERKHEKLGIDELLGFIDEYSQQHLSRFLLVLNDGKISGNGNQKNLWEILREKVIDHEIKLSTSPEEAFSIAIGIMPSKYAEAIKRASITCSLTNIRVILKVIKAANRILADRDLEEAVQARVVPSIVLFSAIHYRGMDGGPDFEFALNAGNPDWAESFKDICDEPTTEQKQQNDWRMLIHELGIFNCDDFEVQLVSFFESGLFEADNIEATISRYMAEIRAMEARKSAHDFLSRVHWDHRVDDAQLVSEAAVFLEIADLLDPYTVTNLQLALADLSGGCVVGDAIVDSWILGYRGKNPSTVNDENPFNSPLHQKIQDEFSRVRAMNQANTNVVDACMHIIENGSWGALQKIAMRQATAADFEAAIRGIEDLYDLRRFMRQMIGMRIERDTYDALFGKATQHFVEACQAICNDASSPRLAKLVKRLFEGTRIASELSAQPDADGPIPAA